MRKKNIIVLVIILVIGFASITSTLVIRGNLRVGINDKDFDVYFSNAIENSIENKKLIKDDTHISFTKDMSLKGETYELEYDVTNGSRNYDADIKINCTESNEYIRVENEFDESEVLEATKTRRGVLRIEVVKPYNGSEEETKNIEITCTIVGSALERDILATNTPADKVKQCTLDDPLVYKKGSWEYRDNDCSGDISVGDLVTLDTESFYVYNLTEDNVIALSKYNLYVGNNCFSTDPKVCEPIENPTGLQDSRAIGYLAGEDGEPAFPYVGVVSFNTNSNNNEVPDYSKSIIKEYVDAYALKLADLGGTINSSRIITKEELESLGCNSNNYSCKDALSFIFLTSYWTSSISVENNNYIWAVNSQGTFGVNPQWYDLGLGIRPVIEVSKNIFK